MADKPPVGTWIGSYGPFTKNGRPRRIVSMGTTQRWVEPAGRRGRTRAGQGGRMVTAEVFEDLSDRHWAAALYEDGTLQVSEPTRDDQAEWTESLGTVTVPRHGSGRFQPAESDKRIPISEYGR